MKVLLSVILSLFINFIPTTGGECGSAIEPTVRKRDDRIVGGFDVGYYKYPWYVALIRKDIVSCGGTLIGPKTVLTAAHCFKQYLVSSKSHKTKLEDVYSIKLGVYNMCETESTQGLFKAEKVKIHELYLQKVPYYDICIITLTKNADQFTPICLPGVGFKKPKEGSTPGLGVLKYEGATPCTLHEGRLLIHTEQSCKKMLIAASGSADNFTNAFCAGYMQGGIDTCQGDSGGPLQVTAVNGKYILLGIVSFGFRCANPGLLGIYTDVSKYVEWIKEHSGSDQFEHNISDGSSTNGDNTNGSSSNGDNSGSDTNENNSNGSNSDGQISAINSDISDVNNQIQTGYVVENPFQILPQRIPYKRPLSRPINLIIINERKKANKMKKHHKPKN